MDQLTITAISKLPVANWVESFTDWLTKAGSGFFDQIQTGGQGMMNALTQGLLAIPIPVFIGLLTIAAFFVSGRRWSLPTFTLVGTLFIWNQGLWSNLMNTVTLVLFASLVSILIGVPLGIWMAKSETMQTIQKPLLDFMQTMPGFVYLIPAVAFFGIGVVPGVVASVIFALPPTVRMTNLGIRQVDGELVEAADSFGSTGWQKLFKVELPLAKSTIMAGINQTTMLALSMVVIASMIGAPGLGRGVLSALQRAQVGNGFVYGVALVILAIIVDRFTQSLNRPRKRSEDRQTKKKRRRFNLSLVTAMLVIAVGSAITTQRSDASSSRGNVKLSYVQWDTEVASTNVIGEVLRQMGYQVELTPLDNAIMWQSVAKGESDGMVSAWLPNTHGAQYQKYRTQVDNLGANLTGAKIGLVVPSYMKVNSISELTDQAGQTITGIEPGAGVVTATDRALKKYPNLANWSVATSSTGAMTVALQKAIKAKQPIVITGWSPHWLFAKYDLKYLADPQKVMGQGETINTIVRKDLKQDQPEVYRVLDNFHWSVKDMQSVMLAINRGMSPEKAAREWVKAHPKQVKAWQAK